jgi:hypothetical protein
MPLRGGRGATKSHGPKWARGKVSGTECRLLEPDGAQAHLMVVDHDYEFLAHRHCAPPFRNCLNNCDHCTAIAVVVKYGGDVEPSL